MTGFQVFFPINVGASGKKTHHMQEAKQRGSKWAEKISAVRPVWVSVVFYLENLGRLSGC